MSDLKLAFEALMAKRPTYSRLWDYYLGDPPLVYASERLREIFANLEIKFVENWCGLVIASMLERIDLTGFSVPDSNTDQMAAIWGTNELNLESDDLHEAALVTGESYLIIWPDENDPTRPECYYNDPRLCHVFYEPARPRTPRFAAKLWLADDETYRMTLYYPDRLEYYHTTQKAQNVSSYTAFKPDGEEKAPNPYGIVPVFHFRGRRQIVSEIKDVIPPQNGVNKLLTDMMVAAEYGAFRQRWVISNADTSALKNSPNEIWQIPAGDGMGQGTQVGDFSPTDLKNYLDAVEKLAGDIARITRTPKQYFFNQAGDPSGEALIAMEAPLTRKVEDRIERFSATWQKAMAFAMCIAGVTITPQEIEPVYRSVSTVQPKTQAEIRVYNRTAGIPLITTLRREGWTETELIKLREDIETTSADLGDEMLSAFDAGK